MTPKKIIGRVEKVSFPELGIGTIHARVDTGAHTSAIWATARVSDNRLEVIFFGPDHPLYDGKTYYFDEYSHGMVSSSNGQSQLRYKVRVLLKIAGRRIRTTITLADRSAQAYPMLIGRNVLRGKFIVDVKKGTPLIAAERVRSHKIQSQNPGELL